MIQDNQDNRYVGAKSLQVQAKSTNALKCLDYLPQVGVAFCWAHGLNLSWYISFTSAHFIMFLTFATSTAVCMSVLIISFPS
ncbi:MAG TPA: hypothetical protein VF220_03050, partial [Nitrososphaeraceae archaeon]